jgi:hypothetical protein
MGCFGEREREEQSWNTDRRERDRERIKKELNIRSRLLGGKMAA